MNTFANYFTYSLLVRSFRMVLLVCPIVLLFGACHTNKNGRSKVEDFDQFYKKFHTDSLFQISRIIFPLEGLPSFVDEETYDAGSFRWEVEDWEMHHTIDYKEFPDITQRLIKQPTEVTEFVDMGSGLGLERKFVLRNKKWFLIYYVGINKVGN